MTNNFQNGGFVSIIAFIIFGIVLILAAYFLSFTATELKISKSYEKSLQTYYWAEAGINEAIWKLKNDAVWANQFITNPTWSASFSRSFLGGSYTVSIENFEVAQGTIIATSTIDLGGGKTSQRVVKTVVFKAIGSPVEDSALFSDGPSGNMNLSSSNVTINDGNLFCGNTINISSSNITVIDNAETEELEGKLLANNNYIVSGSSVTTEAVCSANRCDSECEVCPAPSSDLPVIDFDSGVSTSFKSRAQAAEAAGQCQILCDGNPCSTKCALTGNQFSSILSGASSITINNEITFVAGAVDISSKNSLVINGIIIAGNGNDLNISSSNVTINRPSSESPSGLISSKKINITSSVINGTGVMYSSDEFNISSSSGNITGGVLGRKFDASSLSPFVLTLSNNVILYGLGYLIDGEAVAPNAQFSPVITIDHWEEEY